MKLPNINKFSKASQLSLLAIFILLGAVFFTVNSALVPQQGSSHASSNIIYQQDGYTCYLGFLCSLPTPIVPTPTQIPIQRYPTCPYIPPCKAGLCPQYKTPINCVPGNYSPTATPTQRPTPTPSQTTCIIRPTCRAGEACPQYIGIGNCSPTSTPIPTPTTGPTATPTPTSVPQNNPSVAPPSVAVPSTSAAPGDTIINVVVGLDGIGTAGDRSNPNSDGNMSPLHPQRTITLSVFNSQNEQVVNQQGTITYNATTGQFNGSVDVGSQITTGAYTVKIQTAQYLRSLVPGIQSLTAGQTNTLPYVALVAGDINGDNQINILDYNILMGCYSDLLPAISCTSANQVLADLNDDGGVNQFDYNLFLRELSNVGGQ